MKIFPILCLAIATTMGLMVILDLSFRVDLELHLQPVKEIRDLFLEGQLIAARVYSNRNFELMPNGILLRRVKPSERIELYFESKGFMKKTKSIKFTVQPDLSDFDQDGYPDCLMLDEEDAKRFRNWFIWIGISAFKNDSQLWNEQERDCSGFVRYCTREALKKHDDNWLVKTGYIGPLFEDVEKYNYPYVPILGDRIFRVKEGEFKDISEFSTFATARILYEKSMRFVSKDVRFAKPADVMVFFHPEDFEYPYHLMVYLGDLGTDEREGWIFYHTGPIGDGSGELRFVKFKELMKFDPSWMPSAQNRYFLGFYRFKFLP
ncbi:MAG: DUF1175 domain-containing protein [Pseudothermotoga sp.]